MILGQGGDCNIERAASFALVCTGVDIDTKLVQEPHNACVSRPGSLVNGLPSVAVNLVQTLLIGLGKFGYPVQITVGSRGMPFWRVQCWGRG